jgi:hypothetical protein
VSATDTDAALVGVGVDLDGTVQLAPTHSIRYCHLMLTRRRPFRLAVGTADAQFYAAHVAMNQRTRPGVMFELAIGHPWRWTGHGDQVEATLVDVLAAAHHALLAHLDGSERIRLRDIQQAHQEAIDAALADGNLELLRRLQHEQSMVAASNLLGEEEAAELQHIEPTSLNNQRLMYKSSPPPVLIAGETRRKWLWAREQYLEWLKRRGPGRAWRKGHTYTFPTRECPHCHRPDITYYPPGRRGGKKTPPRLRRHKVRLGGPWCPVTTLPADEPVPAAAN